MATLIIILLILAIAFLLWKLNAQSSASSSQVTEEEIKAIINEGTESGAIQEIEQDIVENVFLMGDRKIRSLMVPVVNIDWLDLNDTDLENKEKIKQSFHSIFPIGDGNIDKIESIVFMKDLLVAEYNNEPFNLKKHAKTPLFFPQNSKAFKVLEKFKETNMHFAVVVNEFGGTIGIVTMKDILETLVHNAGEEFADGNDIIERADGSWLIDSSIPFADLVAHLRIEPSGDKELNEINTLGGLVFNLARSIPKTGDKFYWKGHTFEVVDMDGRRIDKVLVSKEKEERKNNFV